MLLNRKEDEARIRHRLGLALWQNNDLEAAREQLDTASQLFQGIRREVKGSAEFKISLYDLQTACYQSLQRILVLLGRTNDALLIAEKSRNRAFVDLLQERHNKKTKGAVAKIESSPETVEELEKLVNRQKATVLYYSLAAGYLYSWLIMPHRGIVKFHQTCLIEDEEELEKPECERGGYMLENHIQSVRESLGIDSDSVETSNKDEEETNTSMHPIPRTLPTPQILVQLGLALGWTWYVISHLRLMIYVISRLISYEFKI